MPREVNSKAGSEFDLRAGIYYARLELTLTLQRRDFENAKYPGGKISPLIYYYNRQGAKWPGARTGNKKSSKSFSDLLLSLVAGGGWYSVLKV